ncbi:hypothetical protein COBT_000348 [Conglomerata obtusa]
MLNKKCFLICSYFCIIINKLDVYKKNFTCGLCREFEIYQSSCNNNPENIKVAMQNYKGKPHSEGYDAYFINKPCDQLIYDGKNAFSSEGYYSECPPCTPCDSNVSSHIGLKMNTDFIKRQRSYSDFSVNSENLYKKQKVDYFTLSKSLPEVNNFKQKSKKTCLKNSEDKVSKSSINPDLILKDSKPLISHENVHTYNPIYQNIYN